MRRGLVSILSLVGLLAISASNVSAQSGSRSLLFLGNDALPPMEYLKDGKPCGLVVDLGEAIAKRMHSPVEFRFMDWGIAQKALVEGRADALIHINPSPEREQLFYFSHPLLYSEFSIFALFSKTITNIADLRGLRVGLEERGFPMEILKRDPLIKLNPIHDVVSGFLSLQDGVIDALVVDRRVGEFVMAENGIKGIGVTGDAIHRSFSAIAVRDGDSALLADINNAISEIKQDGTYAEVLAKWEPSEIYFQVKKDLYKQRAILIALAVGCSIFAGVGALLLYQLKRRKRIEDRLRQANEKLQQEARERNQAEEQLARNFDAMTRLQKLGTLFVREGNLESILSEIVDAAIVIAGADFGTIQLLDRKSGDLRIAAQLGLPQWWPGFWDSIASSHGASGAALARGERVIVEDVGKSPIYAGIPGVLDTFSKTGVRAVQSTPLVSRSGQLFGVFSTHYREPQRPPARALALLDLLAQEAADILARLQAEVALHESGQRYTAIHDHAPFAIGLMRSSDGVITEANEAWERLFDCPREKAIGKTSVELGLASDPELRAKMYQEIQERGIVRNWEMRFHKLTGEERIGSFYFDLIDIGGVKYHLGTALDITERKKAEEELRSLNENLEKLVQERTEKLRRLASELTLTEQRERKNLSRILHDGLQQYVVAAKMQLNNLHGRIENLGRKQEAREIEQLLDQAVQVSRTLAAELSPPILRDSGILAGLEWLSRWNHEKFGLKVQLVMDMDAPELSEDIKILLFGAVREILLNVVKHAQTDSVKIHLFQSASNQLGLTVSDNGKGFAIDAEISRASKGLGLFSIKERLSLIGGSLEMNSAPGKGARLTMRVPLEEAKSLNGSQEAATTLVPPSCKPAASKGKIKILLVDDHAVMREGLSRLLAQEIDFEIVGQAANGKEAVEQATLLQPMVILMDVSMPVMGGIEATEIIHRQHPHIRIVGLSLYTKDEREKEMLAAGASSYLSKSGPSEELIAAIRCFSAGEMA